MKLFLAFILLSSTSLLLAAGGGHGGSILDLKYPAFNFTLIAVFVLWKVRPMVNRAFDKFHDSVSEAFNLAEVKEAEAQMELESMTKKLNAAESEAEKILTQAKQEADKFEAAYLKETEERIERNKNDVDRRIRGEKEEAINDITEELVEKIVSETKLTVNSDGSKKQQVVERFMARL